MTTEDRGGRIVATCICMTVLSILAVALRFASRGISKKFGWDDWFALASLPFVLAICALTFYWVSLGLGKQVADITTPITKLLIPLFVFNYIYDASLTLTKISVLLFYDRIFGRNRNLRMSLWITGSLIVAWWIMIDTLATFTCVPVQKLWKPEIKGTCIGIYKTYLAASIPNLAFDFVLLFIPMPMLWKLQIKLRTKIGVICVFVCGYGVIFVSIMHLIKLFELGPKSDEDINIMYDIEPLYIFTILEPSMALICCCLPTIFHLVKQVYAISPFGKSISSTADSNKSLHRPPKPIQRDSDGFIALEDRYPGEHIPHGLDRKSGTDNSAAVGTTSRLQVDHGVVQAPPE